MAVSMLSKREISDLLAKNEIKGPMLTKTFRFEDSIISGSGYEKCYKQAVKIAQEENFQIITSTFDSWVLGQAEVKYQFYRFKN